jgi:hypothetical protein
LYRGFSLPLSLHVVFHVLHINSTNFYVTQGLDLDDKYVGQLKNIFIIFAIIDIAKWIIVVVGGILSAAGGFVVAQKLTNNAAAALGRNSPEVAPLDLETPPRY